MSATVLLIEPDGEMRELIRLFLQKSRIDVIAAANEDEARAAMETHSNDIGVILMDVRCAGNGDPRLLTREGRKQKLGREVPTIGIGRPSASDQARAHWLGCEAFLPKPLHPGSLLSAVGRACA